MRGRARGRSGAADGPRVHAFPDPWVKCKQAAPRRRESPLAWARPPTTLEVSVDANYG